MANRIRIAFLVTTVLVLAGVPQAPAQTLKVMNWNIQHGNEDGIGHESEQVDFIVAQNPDVVILQEVSTPDHHLTYQSLLQQKTNRTWNLKYKEHCQLTDSPTQVCTTDNDGVAILTPLQLLETGDEVLWGRDGFTDGRRVVRVKVRVGTQDVQIFGTHLAAGGSFEHIRVSQIAQLKTWMSGFTGPRILGGDLNAVPGSQPIQDLINGGYVDTWAALKSEDGFTHNVKASLTRRIDYCFSQAGSAAQPLSVDRPLFPSAPLSDHYAVVAVYSFGTPTGSGPLVGHWKLDDSNGSETAMDSSGGAAHGTLINSPTWTTSGKVGGALGFNGTTNLVSIPNQPSWNKVSSKYTVAFWVKVEQVENYAGAVAVGNWGTRALEVMTVSNQWSARIATDG
ncbi:MAG: endonuclease/exonuclease/phosphatase family protein, partial [Thermoanaerobaculia bacterium]